MIITQIENAIIARLTKGMGRMVDGVQSYGGELDAGLAEVVRVLPGAWVTFGGIQKTEPVNTTRRKYRAHGRFVVMVGDTNVRGEEASRHGGAHSTEVGTNNLVYAVRRLLSGQDLGLSIDALMPGRVRTLFNTALEHQAISVFACEFDTHWIELALDAGRYPDIPPPTRPPEEMVNHPDYLFTRYGGQGSEPYPNLHSIHASIDEVNSPLIPDIEGIVNYDPDH
ncbi:DUF1834 family protein [Limnobaculum xujianqingii]|uniref:DUF1834 family protein n=1 Tax=Limnobaculum xujianqingii TaxID=2738837 RepID=UPI0011294706|nr:DUF1834 family protein [Limnobaculum xujianqingii]